MTIPVPQRFNNRLEEFYALQSRELIKMYEVGLIKSTAYVHFALRLENPYCDRPVQIIPKEFALRWKIPEKSVYRAIARLKELGILNIKSGKLVVEWIKPEKEAPEEKSEDLAVNQASSVNFSELRNQPDNSQSCEKILTSEKKFSLLRKNSQSCENREPKPLTHIRSGISQTIQTIQTNQTRGGQEKTFSQNQELDTTEAVKELVPLAEDGSKVDFSKQNESVGQTTAEVAQEATKMIFPGKKEGESCRGRPFNKKRCCYPWWFKRAFRRIWDKARRESVKNDRISSSIPGLRRNNTYWKHGWINN